MSCSAILCKSIFCSKRWRDRNKSFSLSLSLSLCLRMSTSFYIKFRKRISVRTIIAESTGVLNQRQVSAASLSHIADSLIIVLERPFCAREARLLYFFENLRCFQLWLYHFFRGDRDARVWKNNESGEKIKNKTSIFFHFFLVRPTSAALVCSFLHDLMQLFCLFRLPVQSQSWNLVYLYVRFGFRLKFIFVSYRMMCTFVSHLVCSFAWRDKWVLIWCTEFVQTTSFISQLQRIQTSHKITSESMSSHKVAITFTFYSLLFDEFGTKWSFFFFSV